MKRLFSVDCKIIRVVLAVNIVLLTSLILLAFVLPLAPTKRWGLALVEAVLLGVSIALYNRARKVQ